MTLATGMVPHRFRLGRPVAVATATSEWNMSIWTYKVCPYMSIFFRIWAALGETTQDHDDMYLF